MEILMYDNSACDLLGTQITRIYIRFTQFFLCLIGKKISENQPNQPNQWSI
jgi:hypothetical protein